MKGLEDEELPTYGDTMSVWGDGKSLAGMESVGNQSMPALGRNWETSTTRSWFGRRRGSIQQPSTSTTLDPIIKDLVDEELPTCDNITRAGGDGRSLAGMDSVGNQSMPALGQNLENSVAIPWFGRRRGSLQQPSTCTTSDPTPVSSVIRPASTMSGPAKEAYLMGISEFPDDFHSQESAGKAANLESLLNQSMPALGRNEESALPISWVRRQNQSSTSFVSMPVPSVVHAVSVKAAPPIEAPECLESSVPGTGQQSGASTRELEEVFREKDVEKVLKMEIKQESHPDEANGESVDELPKSSPHKSNMEHLVKAGIPLIDQDLSNVGHIDKAIISETPKPKNTREAAKKGRRSSISSFIDMSLSKLREESVETSTSCVRRRSIFGILRGSEETGMPPQNVKYSVSNGESDDGLNPIEESGPSPSIVDVPGRSRPREESNQQSTSLHHTVSHSTALPVDVASEPIVKVSSTSGAPSASVSVAVLIQAPSLEREVELYPAGKSARERENSFDDLEDDDEYLDRYFESLVAKELGTRRSNSEGSATLVRDRLEDNLPSERSAEAIILSNEKPTDEGQGTKLLDTGDSDDLQEALQGSINDTLEALKDGLDKTPRAKKNLEGWFERNTDRHKTLSSVEDKSYGDIESVEGYSLQENLSGRRNRRHQSGKQGGDNELRSVNEIGHLDDADDSHGEDVPSLSDCSTSEHSDSEHEDASSSDRRQLEGDMDCIRGRSSSDGSSEDGHRQESLDLESVLPNPDGCFDNSGEDDGLTYPDADDSNPHHTEDDHHHGGEATPEHTIECSNRTNETDFLTVEHQKVDAAAFMSGGIPIDVRGTVQYVSETEVQPVEIDLTEEPQKVDAAALMSKGNPVEIRGTVQDASETEVKPVEIVAIAVGKSSIESEAATIQPREIETGDEQPQLLGTNANGGETSDGQLLKDFPRHDGTPHVGYHLKDLDETKTGSKKRVVSFDKVIIREHNLVPGDNPACSDSLPISLDWDHGPVRVWTIDDFENVKHMFPIPEDAEGMARRLSWVERRELLMEVGGYSDRDIRLAEGAFAKMLKDDRKKLEESKVSGFFSRLFSSGSRSEPQLLQDDKDLECLNQPTQGMVGESTAEVEC